MHPSTLTEQAMARTWRQAEHIGTDTAWYDAAYALHSISCAMRATCDEIDLTPDLDAPLRQRVADWDFLAGMALQRALMASRAAKTVRLEVAA